MFLRLRYLIVPAALVVLGGGAASSYQTTYPIFLCYPASQTKAGRGKLGGGGIRGLVARFLPTM
jgi:hypothetical protein